MFDRALLLSISWKNSLYFTEKLYFAIISYTSMLLLKVAVHVDRRFSDNIDNVQIKIKRKKGGALIYHCFILYIVTWVKSCLIDTFTAPSYFYVFPFDLFVQTQFLF